MKAVKSALSGIQGSLSGFSLPKLPTLGREVAIPVYVIHNAQDPEDYFFIFDFEEFVERSQEGMFVRPKLKVWTGRDDFNRTRFARQFRESFAAEFDAARSALAAEKKQGGWFGWLAESTEGIGSLNWQTFVAYLVLLVSLNAGRKMISAMLPKGLFGGKSDERKLEDNIEATKSKVDEALERLELVLHLELCAHANYGDMPEGFDPAKYDDWPLPDYVKEHVDDRKTGSWW